MFNCVGCLKKQQLKQTTKNVSKFLKKNNKKLQINLALNYGSKIELINAFKSLQKHKIQINEKNLRKYLQNFKEDLEDKVYSRLQRNPIRAIDSKDNKINKIFEKAKDISAFLNNDEKESFLKTINSLKKYGFK